MSWHMKITELTRRLLAEGYTPEDTPPGMREYNPYDGGWTYNIQTLSDMVFETPCGLLAKGSKFLNGYMSRRGVDWRPENDNPVMPCLRFPTEPCPLRDALLQDERYDLHADDVVYQCALHQTDRPYVYEESVDRLYTQISQEAQEQWELFRNAHKGRVCRHQCRYGRTSRTWSVFYSPLACAHMCAGCTHCDVLAKDLDPKKGNVFYDVKKTWCEKGEGLFPDEERSSIEKGIKLLDERVSLTVCEAIICYGRKEAIERIMGRYHHALFMDPTLKVEVLNLRATRIDARDIHQDLRDIENGIQVTHASDTLKAAKEQKRARRQASKARRVRKAEQMILTHGWSELDKIWQYRAKKLLDTERIADLLEQRRKAMMQEPPEKAQLSLF